MGDYETLASLLIRGLADDGDAQEMVDLTRRAFGLVAVGFSRQYDWEGLPLVAGDLRRWMEVYPEVGHDDPCVPFLQSTPEGTWYFAAREKVATDTQRAFTREEFSDVAIARFSGPRGELLPCALYRERVAGPFDDEDHARLQRMVPLWAGALRTQTALNGMRLADDDTCPSLGWVEVGYPSMDVAWSKRARQAFEQRLGPVSARGWTRIERAIVRLVSRSSATMRRHEIVGGLCGEIVHVPALKGERRRVRVLLYATNRPDLGTAEPRTPAEELLSTRQRTIARMVARGCSTPAIAEQLGIAAETVRHHLRTIYQRLGIRKREALRELVD